MFLTQLRLDPRSAQARRDLGDAYEMHRTLTRVFASERDTPPSRFLWRAEPTSAWSDPVVLVQSSVPGNWTVLSELSGYLKHEAVSKVFLDNPPQVGNRYRFRLYANPTVLRDKKRIALVGEEEQLAWLQRQGVRSGFELEAALVMGSEMLRSRKTDAHISLLKVYFEGRLKVSDSSLLLQALQAGIGRGKAFGCGLLSLA